MDTTTHSNGAVSVFLVDDDNMFLKSLGHHLQQKLKEKVKIQTFSTGEACLKNLAQNPNIIVLDYFLNGMDQHAMNGVQVLEKIKLSCPKSIVIMLSGQEKMQVAVDSIKYGAFDYVIKNESTCMKMHNIIRNVLKSIKMEEQLKFYRWFIPILISIIAILITTAIAISSQL